MEPEINVEEWTKGGKLGTEKRSHAREQKFSCGRQKTKKKKTPKQGQELTRKQKGKSFGEGGIAAV